MIRFVIRRLLLVVPTLLGIIFIVFGIMAITPGDPAKVILGERATPEAVEKLNREMGFDRPFIVRYVNYVLDLVRGDMGNSYRTQRSVSSEILSRFPTTIRLALGAGVLAALIGVPLGILSAVKQYSIFDISGTLIAMFAASIPAFWLSLMAILLFSLKLGWLPSNGSDTFRHYILPSVSLAIPSAASLLRLTRTTMLETIRQDYIRTARSKGQVERKITFRHALKNALLPVVTVVGMEFGFLLGGAVICEQVYSINGLGTLIVNAIRMKDVPQVTGCALFLAFFFMLVMLVVDILYAYIDPRIRARYQGKKRLKEVEEMDENRQSAAAEAELLSFKKKSQLSEIWRRMKKNRLAMVGLVIFALIVLCTIFADLIVPYQRGIDQVMSVRLQPPSGAHIFGTDMYGRDIFARIIHGTRYSFVMGVIAVLVGITIGGVLGAVAGYYGGMVDAVIMRIVDTIMCIPFMLLSLTIVTALGPGLVNVLIALMISMVPNFTRVIRSAILTVAGMDFIEAARSCGTPNRFIVFKHVLPNAIGTVIVQATMSVGSTIIAAAGMSFIGMGIQPPAPEWGSMLSEGREYMRYSPYIVLFPGLAIAFSALSLNLMGDGLRDALDPRLKD